MAMAEQQSPFALAHRTVLATTGCSVTALRFGTLILAVGDAGSAADVRLQALRKFAPRHAPWRPTLLTQQRHQPIQSPSRGGRDEAAGGFLEWSVGQRRI